MSDEQKLGPRDSWVGRLFIRYNLIKVTDEGVVMATDEEIEAKATELLRDPLTKLTGAEIALGRRIDGGDQEMAAYISGGSAEDRFAAFLLLRAMDSDQI